MGSLSLFLSDFSLGRTIAVVLAVTALASFDLIQRVRHRRTHYLFACVLGTVLSVGLIKITTIFLTSGLPQNAVTMALAVLLLVLGWKALFGPWEAATKVTVLGTFLFWIALTILLRDPPDSRMVRVLAAGVALVPAAVWCLLFLKYHRERFSSVLLLFLSGMLATVPILFYDALVRHGVTLNFFLFTVTPESFNQSSQAFAAGQLVGGGVRTALLGSFVSFLIVGFIEEGSKLWVLQKSGQRIFSSIDDVLQLSIITAIGFAFAENIINPTYFTGFVRDFLLHPDTRDIGGFLTNVLGRSVLTTMVHVVSTGVAGYFLGRAIFAQPFLEDEPRRGAFFSLHNVLHRMLRLPEAKIFRAEMVFIGLASAILLHSAFNFLVTLPDMLPGHPQSLGQMLRMPEGSFLQNIPFLLLPSLFYVVGGFWLLTELCLRRENQKERGHVVVTEVLSEEEVEVL